MGIFRRKKGDEVIDFSEMYRRGMIKENAKSDESEVLDFTPKNEPAKQEPSNDNFDFLGDMAEASSGSVADSLRVARNTNRNTHSVAEFNELKLKLDDTNFKLNNLINKVQELESKLKEFRL